MFTVRFSSICYAFQRNYWRKLWPFRRGVGLPARLAKRLTTRPLWVELQPGVMMRLDPRDMISRVLLETGEWEQDTWRAIASHLGPGRTFVDVGAHIGHCSLMAAGVVGPNGLVIAIEGNPRTVKQLRDNVWASGARVNVQSAVCSSSEKFVDFFISSGKIRGKSSISQANASVAEGSPSSDQIKAYPLDSILTQLRMSRVDVLKIDVEGAELEVLRGAKDTLTRHRPVLIIELEEELLATMGTSSSEVHDLLATYGYRSDGVFDDANNRFIAVG